MNRAILEVAKVKDLDFSDLYLGHPTLEDRFSDVAGVTTNLLSVAPLLRSNLDGLISICREAFEEDSAMNEFKVRHDDVSYRVSVIYALGGNVFVVRKIEDTIYSLTELGIPQAYSRRLMEKNLSGLLIISGAVKSGKTMTACAIIKARLSAYGGVAVTGEEVVELPLEGNYGRGICYQTKILHDVIGSAGSFRRLMRWGAKIIFVDEIRDKETAAEILQASINGYLIITTMLAENVIQTITKIHALCNDRLVSAGVQSLLADGLLGVLHQNMVFGPKQKIEMEFLFLKDAPFSRAVIRNGKFELLASDIKQQMASMITEAATAQRYAEG